MRGSFPSSRIAQRTHYIDFEVERSLALQEEATAIPYRGNHGVSSEAGGLARTHPAAERKPVRALRVWS